MTSPERHRLLNRIETIAAMVVIALLVIVLAALAINR